jgi:predicted transcriptional regulator
MSPRYSLRVLENQEEVMPTWRADYFDKAREQAPTRSVIIEAERESDALDKARAEMRSTCSRAELIRIDFNSSATTQ